MSTQPAQSRTIRAQLLSDMREGRYAACERLPRGKLRAGPVQFLDFLLAEHTAFPGGSPGGGVQPNGRPRYDGGQRHGGGDHLFHR